MDLVTLAELKDYLKINSTNEDARFANLISFASKVVETYIGREVLANNYIEYHDGGRNSVFVDRLPVNNVSAVAEFNGNNYVTLTGPNPDGSLSNAAIQYMWDDDTGRIRKVSSQKRAVLDIEISRNSSALGFETAGNPTFLNFIKGVKIDYNAGYDGTPNDLKLATLEYIKMLHKQDFAQAVSFQGESKQNTDLSANFPAHIRSILEFYRLY